MSLDLAHGVGACHDPGVMSFARAKHRNIILHLTIPDSAMGGRV